MSSPQNQTSRSRLATGDIVNPIALCPEHQNPGICVQRSYWRRYTGYAPKFASSSLQGKPCPVQGFSRITRCLHDIGGKGSSGFLRCCKIWFLTVPMKPLIFWHNRSARNIDSLALFHPHLCSNRGTYLRSASGSKPSPSRKSLRLRKLACCTYLGAGPRMSGFNSQHYPGSLQHQTNSCSGPLHKKYPTSALTGLSTTMAAKKDDED